MSLYFSSNKKLSHFFRIKTRSLPLFMPPSCKERALYISSPCISLVTRSSIISFGLKQGHSLSSCLLPEKSIIYFMSLYFSSTKKLNHFFKIRNQVTPSLHTSFLLRKSIMYFMSQYFSSNKKLNHFFKI